MKVFFALFMLHYNSEFIHVALAHLSLLLSNKCCILQFIYFNEHLSFFQLIIFFFLLLWTKQLVYVSWCTYARVSVGFIPWSRIVVSLGIFQLDKILLNCFLKMAILTDLFYQLLSFWWTLGDVIPINVWQS